MIITVSSKRFELIFVDGRQLPGKWGETDDPAAPGKQIRLRRSLLNNPPKLAEILIHELLHAAGWPLSEEFVARAAADIARALDKLGLTLAWKDPDAPTV